MRATQGTQAYRPSQFAFTIPQPRQPLEEYIATRTHKDSDGSESTRPSPTPKMAFTFEAPMRPLDVARSMYLDYTTTQSIKFYNKGVEKLPGEPCNGKLLLTWLIQVQDKANLYTWTLILTVKGKLLTHSELYKANHRGCQSTCTGLPGQEYQGSIGFRDTHPILEGIHHQVCIQQGLLTEREVHYPEEEYL
jgi:hypothetical protein